MSARNPGKPFLPARWLRLSILLASLAAVLVATVLLAFVWEFSLYRDSARIMFPPSTVFVFCVLEVTVGLVFIACELRKHQRYSVFLYPALAFMFAGGSWGFVKVMTYDFTVGTNHPVVLKPAKDVKPGR